MAKDQSVAPKERVNIVYHHAVGDAQEEKELPLKLMVMGDFTLRSDPRPLEERKPVTVDKDSFASVMKEQNLQLTLTVPNKLSDKPDDKLSVDLKFLGEKDFGPDSIVQQVPALKLLLELRDALKFLRSPLGNNREFRQKIEQIVKDPLLRERLLGELKIAEESHRPTTRTQ